jgi:hypothetical protein
LSFTVGVVFLGEAPHLLSVLGACIIMGSTALAPVFRMMWTRRLERLQALKQAMLAEEEGSAPPRDESAAAVEMQRPASRP